MASPLAEVEVGEDLVRRLLLEQQPDLAPLPLEQLDAGWDNHLWRLGKSLLVRLPRHHLAAPLILNEQRWLPELGPILSLPVPMPFRRGLPGSGYPWAWSVLPWLPGVPGDRALLTNPSDAAAKLGQFLAALHVMAPADAPVNPWRGVPLIRCTETFEQRLAHLGAQVDATQLRDVWGRAMTASPHRAPSVWLHGDLHPANVLIEHGTLSAVIDFGDICSGDPATDVAAIWMLLPSPAHEVFEQAYGGLDDDLRLRSLGWATLFALSLLEIGLEDKKSYEPVTRRALERIALA